MTRLCSGFARRLFAALLALQLMGGVSICRVWYPDCGAGEEASAQGSCHESDGSAHDDHPHEDDGHHGCPEAFVAPALSDLFPRSIHGRLEAPQHRGWPSPFYDVPPPVPIA